MTPWPVDIVAADERRTAVLFFHGLGASKESHAKEARSLADAGFTAVLPDAPHHGARRSPVLDEMHAAKGADADRILARLVTEAADEVPRMVDWLLERGHPSVAIAGISMGAYIALTAATIEPRVSPIVSILGSPTWRRSDDPRMPVKHPDRFAPRPLLLVNGARDENVPPGPARRFAATLRPLYEARAAGAALVHREYPNATHFPEEADWNDLWSTVVDFLRAHSIQR